MYELSAKYRAIAEEIIENTDDLYYIIADPVILVKNDKRFQIGILHFCRSVLY